MKTTKVYQSLSNKISMTMVKNIIFLAFLAIFSIFVINTFLVEKYIFWYVDQEWLINYSQGFVRRGLSGSLLILLKDKYNLDAFKAIKLFAYLTYLLFAGIYLLKVKQSQKVLNI